MGSSPTLTPTSAPAPLPGRPKPSSADVSAPPTKPTLSFQTSNKEDARRPAIQFISNPRTEKPTAKQKSGRVRGQRRMSSPPPPPVFRQRVSFDTFEKPADFIEENSFTLIAKHKDYEYTRRSRTFLCGLDSNDYSEYALEWLIDELVDDGDEIVCLRVVDKDSTIAEPKVEKGRYRAEAEELMKHIQAKNTDNKAINLILEFSLGKVNKVIEEMINLYEPAILVVGTRGRSLGGFQGLLPGSVSKYCLQHSPVPVIVVRPNSKRAKAKRKRAIDPNRHGYKDLLDKAGTLGAHPLDQSHRSSMLLDDSTPASDNEAAAVAAAIGWKPALSDMHPLAHVSTAPDRLEPAEPTSPVSPPSEGPPSPDDTRAPAVLMKSPELQNLDSPPMSDSESDDDVDLEGGVSTDQTASGARTINSTVSGPNPADTSAPEDDAKSSATDSAALGNGDLPKSDVGDTKE